MIQELRTGGAERLVVALGEGARAAGHDVAVAAAPGPLVAEVGGPAFRVPVVRRRPWLIPLAARAVVRAIRAWRPDVVHAHNPGMALAVAGATRRGAARPAFVSLHGVPDEDYAPTTRILGLAGLPVVACGPGIAVALAEHGLSPLDTIVNGISAPPSPADRRALEAEWRVPPGSPLAVAAGRLAPQKNTMLALAAAARVPELVLAVLGEGPLRDELVRAAAALGVADRVVLAGVRSDARAVIGAADAVVISSHWEGLPLVALEALAAGTPIVATAVRGLRELLEHERTALLAPSGDAQGVADSLRRVLTEPELRERLSRAGQELATEYTEAAMVERYLDLYARLVGKGR